MSHPKRADHFKKWAAMMLEQALVPDRLEYKQQRSAHSRSGKLTASPTRSGKGMNKRRRKRRKRIQRMRRD
jgi:hypothetical protein